MKIKYNYPVWIDECGEIELNEKQEKMYTDGDVIGLLENIADLNMDESTGFSSAYDVGIARLKVVEDN